MTRIVSFYGGECHIEFDPAKHVYVWKEKGRNLPGVTEILKACFPKDALMQWAANLASEARGNGASHDDARFAWRTVSRDAADKGSLVHAFCEGAPHYTPDNIPWPEDKQVRAAAEAFWAWWTSRHVQVIDQEKIVFSRSLQYCGTLDLHAMIDGEVAILDYKTSSGFYREMPVQLAAYAVALEEMTGERICNGWIVRLDKKTAKFEPHYVPINDKLRRTWRTCLDWYRSLQFVDDLTDQVKQATLKGTRLCQTSIPSTVLIG
jgi:hypothetical protein